MRSITDADIDSLVGNFLPVDSALFRVLLSATSEQLHGDLAEMGVLYGASAILIGSYLQPGETFTVIDLFGGSELDDANAEENSQYYPGLTRQAFEANYRRFHDTLPVVVQDLSSAIVNHATHGTHRFVHIDASHLYEHVAPDIANARLLLKPDGIVALDDYRSPHTPGVSAAAWQAVFEQGLKPFLLSEHKMYATWGDTSAWTSAVETWLADSDYTVDRQVINGHPVLRIISPRPRPAHPIKRFIPEVAWPVLAYANRLRRRVLSSPPEGSA